jgi:phosphoribosylaminoimidazolecarboxamide formyltransferase / IMP cyclohydrolase
VSEQVAIKRALISVSDKTNLEPFARALAQEFGVRIISTGGTAKFLRQHGLQVTDVSEITEFPEMMDGRVKTLHPRIHGGLLALRDDPEHAAAMRQHNIEAIDLVCINLYPFEQTIARPGVTFEEAIENIDIGGPSMVRSAAKNHAYVAVVTSPDQYDKTLADLRRNKGATSLACRRELAQAAFAHTARYDARIAEYLDRSHGAPGGVKDTHAGGEGEDLPQRVSLNLARKAVLRYGENPHQKGALYVDAAGVAPAEASVAFATQHHGKELSYINLLDADAALSAVKEFDRPAACIVKHATPCGLGTADDLPIAFRRAFSGDPLAAFGGIVALNQTVDLATARAITSIDKLLEVVVAPAYALDALDLLKSRWKNVRLLEVGKLGKPDPRALAIHAIAGGCLVQQRDLLGVDEANWKMVGGRAPTAQEMDDLRFAWIACKYVKSNAIVIAGNATMYGSGAGQQDRVNACRIAIAKAGERAKGAVAASDAFFPFPDGPELLLNAGVTALIHPGGSVRDRETIDLADRRGAAMVLTGQRHFRH